MEGFAVALQALAVSGQGLDLPVLDCVGNVHGYLRQDYPVRNSAQAL